MVGFQKVANRITMGLVLAALIVGAAMLFQVQTSFRILGYPGFAMLLFLVAAGAGFALLVAIATHDRRDARPRRDQ
jgi:ABC-type polysaccharide/polyol phosphate export permease